jgi:two-component system nitrogen regulation sensor histidine kinase NtrY
VGKILEEHHGGIELADNPAGRGGRVRLWFAAKSGLREGAEGKLQPMGERRRASS